MVQNKVTEGGRNNALFHYGVYAKSKWPENWKTKLMLFNDSAMAKPLSDIEVNIIIKQHEKKIGATNAMINLCVVYVIKNYVRLESLV